MFIPYAYQRIPVVGLILTVFNSLIWGYVLVTLARMVIAS